MTNSILIQNVSPETLTELIKEGVKSQLADFKKELSLPHHQPNMMIVFMLIM